MLYDAVVANDVATAAQLIAYGANPRIIFNPADPEFRDRSQQPPRQVQNGRHMVSFNVGLTSYLLTAIDAANVEMTRYFLHDLDADLNPPIVDDAIAAATLSYNNDADPQRRWRVKQIMRLILDEGDDVDTMHAIELIVEYYTPAEIHEIADVFTEGHIAAVMGTMTAANAHEYAYLGSIVGIYGIVRRAIEMGVSPYSNLLFSMERPAYLGKMSIVHALKKFGHQGVLDRLVAEGLVSRQQLNILERAENPWAYARSVWNSNN
jgi:hypothetical protein